MTKILLHGCNGQMGQVIQKVVSRSDRFSICAKVDAFSEDRMQELCPAPFFRTLQESDCKADVVVDFSHPSALAGLLEYCTDCSLPVVIATTGLDESHKEQLKLAAEKIAVFQSANMSVGINVLYKLAQLATMVLEKDFDIEIIERHHHKKVDSPSGTALFLADAINEVCETKKEYIYGRHGKEDSHNPKELGIHAVRGGTMPGEHTILFAGPEETIELTHRALSKEIFAQGALRAAQYTAIQGPGLYSMKNIIK